jgi:signal transduction histidine kinase
MNARAVDPLRALRVRLTAWYTATFVVLITLLGAGLFVSIRRQITSQLDESLQAAAQELVRAARTREMEARTARGTVVDAVEELRIPDRTLYLMEPSGAPVIPREADEWLRGIARTAALGAPVATNRYTGHDRRLRVYAERFTLASGAPMVAVAIADEVELEDRYAALIAAFGGAAVIALLLTAAGGWIVARKATQPAEESMARMRQFMADAAHELRTPITVLRSRAEVTLQAPRESRAYQSTLEAIDDEARRLGSIVDDLLTLARADSGERRIERRRDYLDDIALDAATAARALADARKVGLHVDEFEEAPVEGDRQLLRQMAMILLDNAIKFTPSGGEVRLRVGPVDGRPTLEVRDNGVGIAPADLPRIFDRFFRGDPSRTRSGSGDNGQAGNGAGLGLSIARWIADEHGGTISVDSTVGSGSTFRVTLPAPASEVSLP